MAGGKLYDTRESWLVAQRDFRQLWFSRRGDWFLVCGNTGLVSRLFFPPEFEACSEEEAHRWLRRWNAIDAMKRFFPDLDPMEQAAPGNL